MNGPVIALDVSKGKSTVMSFLPGLEPFGRLTDVVHGKEGFGHLSELYASLKEATGKEPSFVYESTGVYSLPLKKFLVSKGYRCYQISPMMSAKVRKMGIRPTKTDPIDTFTIARAFGLAQGLRPVAGDFGAYSDLAEMHSYYDHLIECRKVDVNRYKRALAAAWTGLECFVNTLSGACIALVAKYGHPSNVRGKRGVMAAIKGIGMGKMAKESFADLVLRYAEGCSTGCRKDSAMAFEASEMAKRLAASTESLKKARSMLVAMAREAPGFAMVRSVPGIGDTLAAEIIACIGDVSRFGSKSSLVAYAGIDPMVSSSGARTGEHLPITRKGNRYLRHYLYLAVVCIRRLHPESRIAAFVDRKHKNGLCKKAAFVAGSSKLARILYAMMTNLTTYRESL